MNRALSCLRCFAADVTGEFCTRWNERESTWRKSWSCQSRGTEKFGDRRDVFHFPDRLGNKCEGLLVGGGSLKTILA